MNEMEIIEFENLPSNKTPINSFNLNKLQTNAKEAIKNRKPTIELLTVSSAAPTECNIGDKYYNITTSKIYTATATNTWGTEGENPTSLYLYVDLEHKELYYFNGTTFVSYGGGSGGAGGDTLPIGAILPFSSDTIPNGWLLCDGSSFSTTSYPELFDVIGTTYGYDDDRNPKLPDLRGRVAVGKKDATSADDTEFSSLGKTSGEKTHRHEFTIGQLYSYGVPIGDGFDNAGAYKDSTSNFAGTTGTITAKTTNKNTAIANSMDTNIEAGGKSSTGDTTLSSNLQPSLTLNYIIKAKMTVAIEGEIIQENGTASETNVYSSVAVDNKIKTNIVTGQEVATNEYIDGKQVFVKRINLGTLPNSNTLILATGIPSTSIITKCDAMAYASNYTITLPDVAPSNLNMMARITFEAINSVWNVKIITGMDRSNYTGYVNIYYTKN